MKVYNTLSKQKEELIPRNPGKIQMFVCGPTVYDYIHIGNGRTFVFFDVVAKYLRYKKYEIDYIQNITDIDDKIINRAEKENISWNEVASFYFEKFKENIESLGVTSPRYIKATDRINEVKKQVKTLKSKNHIYLIENDGWYFDLKTFPEYGKLSGRTTQMADDGISRIDESSYKKSKGDFCVWKLVDKSEAGFWYDEELGYGRPGWHIEDTAITESEFGPQYDLHGAGQDLMFPHHEAEITQQESASGKKPFVKYWVHVAFLIDKEEKMSKSLGNFKTIHELLKKYPKEVLRFYLLSGHYHQPLEFSDKMLQQSEAGVRRISEFTRKLKATKTTTSPNVTTCDVVTLAKEKFYKAMDDDFNTPEAFAAIFELIRSLNPNVTTSQVVTLKLLEFLEEIDNILGIVPSQQKEIPAEIQSLIDRREKFRQEKKYEESDKIRVQIQNLGYEIEDTAYGPLAVSKLRIGHLGHSRTVTNSNQDNS